MIRIKKITAFLSVLLLCFFLGGHIANSASKKITRSGKINQVATRYYRSGAIYVGTNWGYNFLESGSGASFGHNISLTGDIKLKNDRVTAGLEIVRYSYNSPAQEINNYYFLPKISYATNLIARKIYFDGRLSIGTAYTQEKSKVVVVEEQRYPIVSQLSLGAHYIFSKFDFYLAPVYMYATPATFNNGSVFISIGFKIFIK